MTTYASAIAFLLLLPLLASLGILYWRRRQQRPTLAFSSLAHLKAIPAGLRARLRLVPLILNIVALGLVIVALARPQRADTKTKRSVEGIDIMMVLDVSDSMLIEDMKPVNRMESCKLMIKEFIEKRISDRIGLVVFSGESYTRMPLTLDYKLLLQSLSEVKISRNVKMGTAIGVALANGVSRLRESTAKTRVLILLTDGENNSGTIDPETALEIAKGYGIRVYTIGAGRDGEAQLPIESVDAFGRKYKRYQPIHSTVNDELLGLLASSTGGKYWRAETTNALRGVFNEIDRLERTKIDVNQYTKYAELFPPWLRAGVLIWLVAQILGMTILRRAP
ncbi:MAG: VWA domain-containing protein [Bdellovibrionaceae bacterium]|nr:VWA domain-containing protein [Pseudobdellovibrionaceae bacterium]